jgi:general L-amino acid transport system permease protein
VAELSEAGPQPSARPAWAHSRRWTGALGHALAFALLGGLLFLMFHVTSANLQSRGIHSGFAFLWEPSRTPVTDAPVAVEAGIDSYAKAFAAGALNSLRLTVAALVAATLIGLVVGLGRLSQNALARALCAGYVEVMRNVPVLLHVFLWYGVILGLPAAAQASSWGDLVLASNRGLYLAWPGIDASGNWSLLRPVVDGFEVKGGISMAPEFFALLVGISLYTAAFIAEIVRAAVGSLPRGQWEATAALGLPRATTLRRVVLPQALRVALPPLTSEYLGVFKNSTLAVAVGYQDFMAISTTMLTDTGQAVEVMAIVMAFYAAVSLLVSAAMHAVEHRNMRWGLR